jgi:hypothetical protein
MPTVVRTGGEADVAAHTCPNRVPQSARMLILCELLGSIEGLNDWGVQVEIGACVLKCRS